MLLAAFIMSVLALILLIGLIQGSATTKDLANLEERVKSCVNEVNSRIPYNLKETINRIPYGEIASKIELEILQQRIRNIETSMTIERAIKEHDEEKEGKV